MADSKHINELPDEVLLEIFNGLNVYDRLSIASLVCTRWKNIIRCWNLLRDVELAFSYCHLRASQKPLNVFRNSNLNINRLVIKQKVRYFPFDEDFTDFWRTFGPKIKELVIFYSETLTLDVFLEILCYTPNLKVLQIQSEKRTLNSISPNFFENLKTKINAKEEVLKQNLKNVTSLSLAGSPISNDNFEAFINLMPALKELDLTNVPVSSIAFQPTIAFMSLHFLIEILKQRKTDIKVLHIYRDDLRLQSTNDVLTNQVFLQELTKINGLQLETFSYYMKRINDGIWNDFLIAQNQIKCLQLEKSRDCFKSITLAVNHLKHLKKLMLHDGIPTLDTLKWLDKAPNLIGLCLNCGNSFEISPTFNDELPTKNENLTTLHFRVRKAGIQSTYFKELCLRFPKLTVLHLSDSDIDDQDLHNVFKNLNLLRTLKIDYCYNITSNGLLGITNGVQDSNCSLSNLRGLKMLNLNDCFRISDRAFTDLKCDPFLDLVTLFADGLECITDVGIKAMTHIFPMIRKLKLECIEFIYTDVVDIFHGFKYLKNLNISVELLMFCSTDIIAEHAHHLTELAVTNSNSDSEYPTVIEFARNVNSLRVIRIPGYGCWTKKLGSDVLFKKSSEYED